MKNIFLFPLFLIVFFLFSCAEPADPTVEIFVSVKESVKFQKLEFKHGYISFIHSEKDGEAFGSSPFGFSYDGVDLEIDYTKDLSPILVGNEAHWEENFVGMQADISIVDVTNLDGTKFKANSSIDAVHRFLKNDFELENNGQYRIDFIYDMDNSITQGEDESTFDAVGELVVTKLN